MDGQFSGTVKNVKCTVTEEDVGYSAVIQAHRYLELIKEADYSEAYRLLTDKYRGTISIERFTAEARRLNANNYEYIGSPYCLDFRAVNGISATVIAGADCYVTHDQRACGN